MASLEFIRRVLTGFGKNQGLLNGGEIHVGNMPGKGCVFSIDLPIAA
jgi:hypothetical protein